MKNIKSILIVALTGMMCADATAQVSNFSQYHLTPVYTSPAESGMTDYLQVMTHYRKQSLTADQGYENLALSATYPLRYRNDGKRFGGISLGLMNERSGSLGLFKDESIRAGYAYNWQVGTLHYISVGMQGGYYRTSIAMGRVRTDSQYQNGTYDPGYGLGENLTDNSSRAFKLDGGVTWYGLDPSGQRKFSLGFAAYNVNRSAYKFSAEGDEERLPVRYQVYGSMKAYSKDRLEITPTFRYLKEKNYDQLSIGSLFLYQLQPGAGVEESHLGMGVWYSLDNVAVVSMEWFQPSYIISLAYDLSASSNVEQGQLNNGVELTLAWRVKRLKDK